MTRNLSTAASTALVLFAVCWTSHADDWTNFRGPNGNGTATASALPANWSATENIKWQLDLPGPGTSSPIVLGDRVYLTVYTGYGEAVDNPGKPEDLHRYLLCVDRHTGQIVWKSQVENEVVEAPFNPMLGEHGYASCTPVTDGQHIFVFLGKTGVVAFDQDGNQLWQTSVGTDHGRMRWGTAASPVLFEDLVIVNACEESQSLVALNKESGEEVWRLMDDKLNNVWSTPILVHVDGQVELVLGMVDRVMGVDPRSGEQLWYADVPRAMTACETLIADDGVVYRISQGATAIRAGGRGNVTESHIVWNDRHSSRIGTPALFDDHLYWVNGGIASCVKADTGEGVFKERVGPTASEGSGGPQNFARGGRGGDGASGAAGQGGRGGAGGSGAAGQGGRGGDGGSGAAGQGGRGGAGGGFSPEQQVNRMMEQYDGDGSGSLDKTELESVNERFRDMITQADEDHNGEITREELTKAMGQMSQRFSRGGGGRGGPGGGDYSSPVIADGKVYYIQRSGKTLVFAAKPQFEKLAENSFEGDAGPFNATPAISDDQVFVRSNKRLYCIQQ